jgi:hypothetical protein
LSWVELSLARRLEGPVAFESRAQRVVRERWSPQQLEFIRRESALHSATGLSDVPMIECPVVDDRPYLDGVLDDHAWRLLAQQDRIIRLHPMDVSSPDTQQSASVQAVGDPGLGQTQVLIARDSEHLYLALQCHFVELTSWRESSERQRDGQLSTQDHVEIRFDLDRDGLSEIVFGFDNEGRFSDRIGRSRDWNPDWYFAQARSFNTWTIEAAIPLAILESADPEMRNDVWGLSVERVLPRGIRECWHTGPRGAGGVAAMADFPLGLPDGYLKVR